MTSLRTTPARIPVASSRLATAWMIPTTPAFSYQLRNVVSLLGNATA